MITVKFLLGEPPYEPGDIVELPEAEAENKLLDGIVEYADGLPEAEAEVEAVEEVEETE